MNFCVWFSFNFSHFFSLPWVNVPLFPRHLRLNIFLWLSLLFVDIVQIWFWQNFNFNFVYVQGVFKRNGWREKRLVTWRTWLFSLIPWRYAFYFFNNCYLLLLSSKFIIHVIYFAQLYLHDDVLYNNYYIFCQWSTSGLTSLQF